MKIARLITLLAITVLLIVALAPLQAVSAQLPTFTYRVDTTEDLYDMAPNQVCSAVSITEVPCSLRAAMNEAARDHGPGNNANVVIELPPGSYKLTLNSSPFDPPVEGDDMYYGDLDLPKLENGADPFFVHIKGTGGLNNPSIIDANFIDRVL